mmetsp:Transcript_10287/g.23148  ORF Transcript_10287/g.23148 Transcript_10287/m.23148 type:complete len:303 (+) Transcript_10287:68-976(+)
MTATLFLVFTLVAESFVLGLGGLLQRKINPHATFVDKWGQWTLKRGDLNIFLHHMPQEDVVACGCGKCGSTSMWHFIYEKKFGHRWNYSGTPYVQDVTSSRWEGKVLHERYEKKQEEIMNKSFSFALIRDPKERLISAWKSKIACMGSRYGTDMGTRDYFTQQLLQAAGHSNYADQHCLSLEDFLKALQHAYALKNENFLDRHFLPQTAGCFSKFPPERWSMVAPITDSIAFSVLGERLGSTGAVAAPREHASRSKVEVSPRAMALLDDVTAPEYAILRNHLPMPRMTRQGIYLRMPPQLQD